MAIAGQHESDDRHPALGPPIRPEPAAPVEPPWKPMVDHPTHETNGREVRLKVAP